MDGIYNFRLVVSCSEPLLQKVLHSHLALGQDIGCVLQMNALLINNILGICFLTQIVIFILSILTFKPLASIIKFQSFKWFKRSSYVSFIMTSSTKWLEEIDSELSRMRTKVNQELFADFTIQNYFNFQVWIQRLRKINDPLRNADNFHGSWKQFSCQTNKRLFKLKKPTQKFGSFGRYFSCSW